MIVDYNKDSSSFNVTPDICIVGSGAASLAMLTQLYNTHLQVVVLEAGHEEITSLNQDVYKTINTAHSFPGSMDGRFRVFGGSTTKWGGQSLPLDETDFIKRNWIPNSGWPIKFSDISKYYSRVDDFLDLFPNNYNDDIYEMIRKNPLKHSDDIALHFSKWSPSPNLREKYRQELLKSRNIMLIQNANLLSINLNENLDDASSMTVTNFNGKLLSFKAKKYILACGGIENPRLLLASNKQIPSGIGNNSDLVGRFLQDHPNAHVATLRKNDKFVQGYFNYFYKKKTRFLPRFIFSPSFQGNCKTLNANAYFSFLTDKEDPSSIVKEIYRKYRRHDLEFKDIRNSLSLFKNVPETLKIATSYLLQRKVYTPNAILKLNLMTESPPRFENRVSLSDELDILGMPKPKISWNADDLILHTFKKCTAFLHKYFQDLNLGRLDVDEWMHESDWFDQIKDAKHHIGTTRMSENEKTGVVDINCKIFNLKSLFIAGSSVFPTSGHSNPTSTIVALALRLIEHIKSNIHD